MRVKAQQLIMSSVIRLFMVGNFSSQYIAVASFVASPLETEYSRNCSTSVIEVNSY